MYSIELSDDVVIDVSGEKGKVIGKASYIDGAEQYQVHFRDANGCSRTDWFYGFQISVVENLF